MSRSIRVRARQHIPGGGVDANGSPKQGKVEVWGKIVVTNYNRGGENLAASDLGLKTIEWIDIKFEDAVGTNDGQGQREAFFSAAAQQFYLLESNEPLAATADPVLLFNACGDDFDSELL